MRSVAGPTQNGPSSSEQAATIEKLQKQHSDLMYANAALLKTVKIVAISFGAIALTLIGYQLYTGMKGGSTSMAAPAPAPITLPPVA